MELLLSPSLQHVTRNADYYNSLANFTLHATALRTLMQYLQIILNTATSNTQCGIPALRIWRKCAPNELPHSSLLSSDTTDTTITITDINKNNKEEQIEASVPLMHTIMNVPNWMSYSGNYFRLAADTSPCQVIWAKDDKIKNHHRPHRKNTILKIIPISKITTRTNNIFQVGKFLIKVDQTETKPKIDARRGVSKKFHAYTTSSHGILL